MNPIKIGIIGIGGIARGVHIRELSSIPEAMVTAICDINETALKQVGDQLNIPEALRFTDYRELISSPEVDAVEICTPNYLHVPMAEAAIRAGKPVNIEKPLSTDLDHTAPLLNLSTDGNAVHMMCFSYRFKPAVRYAKHILKKGLLGEVLNLEVSYLKNSAFMEGRRLEWRFVKEYAGTGVLGDLGVHLIDMARFLVGDIDSVCGNKSIVVKERKRLDSEEIAPVETDDTCSFLAHFTNGATGVFHISRAAIGHLNTIKYEIYGTKGVISFDLNNPDILYICLGEIDTESFGMHPVTVPAKYRYGQEQCFIDAINGKKDVWFPDLSEGVACQKILDAILESCDKKSWISIHS